MNRNHVCWTVFWLLLAGAGSLASEKIPATWLTWLGEVQPVMTRAEREAFNRLPTEEDRSRFQAAFWKMRDPDPATPGNEFQREYAQRLAVVREKFGGPQTDRGRLYLLLGKPRTVSRYSGEQDLVECELWNYAGLSGRGLPPFLNFLFYRPRDTGDFKQFYPGMQSAADLISPGISRNLSASLAAYQLVQSVSAELADASLSLIPGEGNPYDGVSAANSSLVMARVQELPEKDVPSSYLRDFTAGEGSIRVSDSSRRIMGWGDIGAAGGGGSWFLSYAMLPDSIAFEKKSDQSYLADIVIYLTVEDGAGRSIYRAEKPNHLDVTAERKREIEEKKVLFRDFCPIVPGRYRIQATFINKGNGDFFSIRRDLAVGPTAPAVLTGFQLAPGKGWLLPFSAGGRVLLSDPRFLYSRRDRLCGLVSGAAAPGAVLLDKAGLETAPLTVQAAGDGVYQIDGSLKTVADGTYALVVRDGAAEIARQAVFIMPDYIKVNRPFSFERSDPEAARLSYQAVLAEQYLNLGRPAEALARLEAVPPPSRTPTMVSLLAQACYNNRDYPKVLEMLENKGGNPTYAELTLLANSAIELKRYDKAAGYLEQLRRYGDTAVVNHLLAAAWTVLGNGAKARQYHQRALELDKNNPE
jgi:GWxTD domain-containing protein